MKTTFKRAFTLFTVSVGLMVLGANLRATPAHTNVDAHPDTQHMPSPAITHPPAE